MTHSFLYLSYVAFWIVIVSRTAQKILSESFKKKANNPHKVFDCRCAYIIFGLPFLNFVCTYLLDVEFVIKLI